MANDDYNDDGRVDSQDVNDELEDEYMDDYGEYLHQLEEQEANFEFDQIQRESDQSADSLSVEDDMTDDYVDLTTEEKRDFDNEDYYRDQKGGQVCSRGLA